MKNDSIHLWIFYLILIGSTVIIGLALSSGCLSKSDIPVDFDGVVPTEGPVTHHIVNDGETLWRIAQIYGVSVANIAGINGIEDPTRISAGERLIIPAKSGKITIRKDFQYSYISGSRMSWPLRGDISRRFAPDSSDRHDGIDIPAATGTPIRAAAAGRVVYSGDQFSGYGKMIIIEHSDSISTIYAHCDLLLVYEGDTVPAGHIIAKVGSTGRTTGPHLHFEVRKNNKAVDPHAYLK